MTEPVDKFATDTSTETTTGGRKMGTASNQTLNTITGAVISGLTIVGLVVLIVTKTASWAEVGPLLGGVAGLHGGATLTKAPN